MVNVSVCVCGGGGRGGGGYCVAFNGPETRLLWKNVSLQVSNSIRENHSK